MNRSSAKIVLIVVAYVISTFVGYIVFSKTGGVPSVKQTAPPPKVTQTGGVMFDPSLPKTEPCPLNGAKYSKQQREWWEKHRPLGVMIENHEEARPQSGLSSADVIYEVVAEGSITRFLAVYYCQDANPIGPVRSARTYFMDFVSEYGEYPLYAHVGGANRDGPADAIEQIGDYGWEGYSDLNQFSVGFHAFVRDYKRLGPVATEHTMYSSTAKLWDYAVKDRGLTNKDKEGNKWDESFTPYTFKDDAKEGIRGKAQTIHVEHWEGYSDYFVDWTYDPKSNTYKRVNGGKPHIDKNTGKQLATKNLIVLTMQETRLGDEEGHLLYKTKGSGKSVIFIDGNRINGTWKKEGRTDRLIVLDNGGNPIKFNRGLIWFEILPLDGQFSVK